MEVWKDIKGYVGLYQVSNFGRVRSLGKGESNVSKMRILKVRKTRCGYIIVNLYKNGIKKTVYIHRLVAEAFIPNLFDYPEVNHKDEDKTNNFCGTPENDFNDGNLEWCDCKYNINYGTRKEKVSYKLTNRKDCSKQVLQYNIDGTLIREWPSIKECVRNGFNDTDIILCCKGRHKTHKGFIWKYKEVV